MTISWSRSVEQAAWWEERLPRRFSGRVDSIVPTGCASYARVFHPFETDDRRTLRWNEVAARTGRVAHASMQHDRIATASDGSRAIAATPPDGSLPPAELGALATLLAEHTSTPDRCWFAVWDGYGGLNGATMLVTSGETVPARPAPLVPPGVLNGPRVDAPGRTYLLATGPLDGVVEFSNQLDRFGSQSPNVWWPDDRSWIVATEIDLFSTYIGGSAAAIDAILASRFLEASGSDPTHLVTFDGDHINM